MPSRLWAVVFCCAVLTAVSVPTGMVRAAPTAEEIAEVEAKQVEVREVQIKYASYGGAGLLITAVAFWMLNTSNQRKKHHALELKKQGRLDPDEGVPLS